MSAGSVASAAFVIIGATFSTLAAQQPQVVRSSGGSLEETYVVRYRIEGAR